MNEPEDVPMEFDEAAMKLADEIVTRAYAIARELGPWPKTDVDIFFSERN